MIISICVKYYCAFILFVHKVHKTFLKITVLHIFNELPQK